MIRTLSKWDYRWLERAEAISDWSKDPSTKVGCVYVNEETHQELSAGYNGFPRYIEDDERLEIREVKYQYIVHAEMNGIFNALNKGVSLQGSTLYLYGLPPCHECAKGIIQVGIKSIVVFTPNPPSHDRWRASCDVGANMMEEAGIEVHIV